MYIHIEGGSRDRAATGCLTAAANTAMAAASRRRNGDATGGHGVQFIDIATAKFSIQNIHTLCICTYVDMHGVGNIYTQCMHMCICRYAWGGEYTQCMYVHR